VKLLRDEGIDVEVHLVGDVDKGVPSSENYKAELCDRITRLDLWGKVHLEGRQPMDGVRRFLGMSQLFIAPFVETDYGDKGRHPDRAGRGDGDRHPVGRDRRRLDPRGGRRPRRRARRPAARPARARDRDPRAAAGPEGRRLMGQKAAQKAREQFDVSICEPRLHDRMRALLAPRS
jgi:hypothetical protein